MAFSGNLSMGRCHETPCPGKLVSAEQRDAAPKERPHATAAPDLEGC